MQRLTCAEREALITDTSTWSIVGARTDDDDMECPVIERTWGQGNERVMDRRYPDPEQYSFPSPENQHRPDAQPCEHFYWIAAPEAD